MKTKKQKEDKKNPAKNRGEQMKKIVSDNKKPHYDTKKKPKKK